MKNMAYSRFLFRITLFVLLGFASWSCDILQPLPDNPYDPLNPDFKEPETRILSGPSGTSTAKEVTINWQQKDPVYRNDSLDTDLYGEIEYSYRLNEGSWSLLSPDTFVTLPYLDDTSYFFQIMSRYPTNVMEDEPYPSRSWTMDAYSSSLILSPRTTILPYSVEGNEFGVTVGLEEVVGMMGAHVELSYDPEGLRFMDYTVLDSTGDFLTQGGGSVINFVDVDSSTGLLALDVAVVTGDADGLNGSGEIFELWFEQLPLDSVSVDTFYLDFGDDSHIRSVDNDEIMLDGADGVIYVW